MKREKEDSRFFTDIKLFGLQYIETLDEGAHGCVFKLYERVKEALLAVKLFKGAGGKFLKLL